MTELSTIQSKIYEIRGMRVMLDFDLAEMYNVETRVLKQAVRRNIDRFPDDFMFETTKHELGLLRSQNVTSNSLSTGYMPFAFTELGVAMLSSVLSSKTAIQINMGIMRAFVAVRRVLDKPQLGDIATLQNELNALKKYIEEVFTDYNDINDVTQMQLDLINQTLAELQVSGKQPEVVRRPIGFVIEKNEEK